MIVEITSLKIFKLHPGLTANRVSVEVELQESEGAALQPSVISTKPVTLAPGQPLAWIGADFLISSSLNIRPSSSLKFRVLNHPSRFLKSEVVLEICAPIADLLAESSNHQPGARCRYNACHEDGEPFAKVELILRMKSHPQFSVYGTSVAGLKLFDLEREASQYSDEFSLEVGYALVSLGAFITKHKNIPSLLGVFLYSSLSVFWRITERIGSTLGRPGYHTSGQLYPLRDILIQVTILLQMFIVIFPDSGVDKNTDLLQETLRELCKCVGIMEAEISNYRDFTWDVAVGSPSLKAGKCAERQAQLFFLTFKFALWAKRGELYKDKFDQSHQDAVIQKMLNYAFEENRCSSCRNHNRSPSQDRQDRPFTFVLASARGLQCDTVWEEVYQRLQSETDPSHRDVCRRILTKMVQAADRIPRQLWIELDRGDSTKSPRTIGVGAFATVSKGWSKRSNECVAIKNPHSLRVLPSDAGSRRKIYLEIVAWKTVNHANLLPFLGVNWKILGTGSERTIGDLGMVSPFMDKGMLKSHYTCPSGSPSIGPGIRESHIQQIVSGMVYLHGERLVHGDLRADNIFVDAWPEGQIKIADFGLCILSQGNSGNYFSMRSGNVRWAAPELLAPSLYGQQKPAEPVPSTPRGDTILSTRPTMGSDVYSFSCVCIELYTGNPPFHDEITDEELREKIYQGKLGIPPKPKDMPDGFWALVLNCRNNSAEKRPSFVELENNMSTVDM